MTQATDASMLISTSSQFLCALPPELRKAWARRMPELLKPTGILVCLEFPLYKNLDAPGPPWGLRGVYWNLLAQGGDGILSKPQYAAQDGQSSGEIELLMQVLRYKPDRTYDVGKAQETDMISVWKRP